MSPPRHFALGPGREFDRIRGIVAALGPAAGTLGDDCAVVDWSGGALVLSTDLTVEGVHFRREWLAPAEIGWRAAAAALSDLAAEGAAAIGLLASVGVPPDAAEGDTAELMRGVGEAVLGQGGRVLGGDLSRAPVWVVDITVVGRAARPVTRSGALPGDGLWVTGTLGGARTALHAWQEGGSPGGAVRDAFAHPEPRLAAGQALAAAGAHAMLDISDGLAGDAGHLAAASGARLEIALERLPLGAGVTDPMIAAQGGEDYELLAAMPAAFGEGTAAAIVRATGVPLSRIGSVAAGTGVRLTLAGREVSLGGYDHFA